MRMKPSGAKGAIPSRSLARPGATWKAYTNAVPAVTPKNCRRVSSGMRSSRMASALRRRALDGLSNAHVGATAADVAGHRRVDLGIPGVGSRIEQGRCGHDLSRLAIAALDDFDVQPRLLHLRAGGRGADGLD